MEDGSIGTHGLPTLPSLLSSMNGVFIQYFVVMLVMGNLLLYMSERGTISNVMMGRAPELTTFCLICSLCVLTSSLLRLFFDSNATPTASGAMMRLMQIPYAIGVFISILLVILYAIFAYVTQNVSVLLLTTFIWMMSLFGQARYQKDENFVVSLLRQITGTDQASKDMDAAFEADWIDANTGEFIRDPSVGANTLVKFYHFFRYHITNALYHGRTAITVGFLMLRICPEIMQINNDKLMVGHWGVWMSIMCLAMGAPFLQDLSFFQTKQYDNDN